MDDNRVTHKLIFDQAIHIGTDISLHLYEIRNSSVSIGVEAPKDMLVDRQEIRLKRNNGEHWEKPKRDVIRMKQPRHTLPDNNSTTNYLVSVQK